MRWDVLHRVTPVTLAAPTWLGRLGIPTVIGPLNSGLTDPPGFSAILRQESTWLVKVREFGRLFDGVIGSSRRAARLLTATKATLNGIPQKFRSRCLTMVENGIDLSRFPASPWPATPDPNNPVADSVRRAADPRQGLVVASRSGRPPGFAWPCRPSDRGR